MNKLIEEYANIVLAGGLLDRGQIDSLLAESESDFHDLLYWSNWIRERFSPTRSGSVR